MTKNANERGREILSEPRVYSNDELQQFIFECSSKTGLPFRYDVISEILTSPIKEQIFFFSSMIIFLTENGRHIEVDVSDNEIKELSKHIAFIISELSKDIK